MSKQSRVGARTTRSRSTLPPGHLNFDHSLYRALDDRGTKSGKPARPTGQQEMHDPLSPTAGPSGLTGQGKVEGLLEKAALLEFAASASSPIQSAAGFGDEDVEGLGVDDIEDGASSPEEDDDDDEENSHRQRALDPADCDWSRDVQDDVAHFRLYPASSTPHATGVPSPVPTSPPSGPLLLPAAEIVSPGGDLGDRAGRRKVSTFLSGLQASVVRGGTLGESADIVGRTPDVTRRRDAGVKTVPAKQSLSGGLEGGLAPRVVAPPVQRKAQARVAIAEPEPRKLKSRRATVQDASDDESDAYVPTARAAAAAKVIADKGKGKAVAPTERAVAAQPPAPKEARPATKPVEAVIPAPAPSKSTAGVAKKAAPPPAKPKVAPAAPEAPKVGASKVTKATARKPAVVPPGNPAAGDDVVMSRAEIEKLVNQAREAGLKEARDALGAAVAVAPAPIPAQQKQVASREEIAQRAEKARRDRARREAEEEAEQLMREAALQAKAARDKVAATQARMQAEADASAALAQERLARVRAEARRLEEESARARTQAEAIASAALDREKQTQSRVMDAIVEEEEEEEDDTPEGRLEVLARENNFASARDLVELYRDVAQVLKSPVQARPQTPTGMKRRPSPKSREEAKRHRHLSPERGGAKRKVSPGEPVSPRKKRGLGREDALGLDDFKESDAIAIPVKCVEILRGGWTKTLRLSMFTPEACRKNQSKALGNEANHLEIGPGGTIGIKGAEKYPADNTLREDEWRPAFVTFIRAIEEHYQPRIPDVDEEEAYLIPSRKELSAEFQRMFNQLTRRKDYETQFKVVKLYTERSFIAIQERRMKMTVGRWGENVWTRCLNEVAAERGQLVDRLTSQMAAMQQQQQGNGQRQRSSNGQSYSGNQGGTGGGRSGGSGGSGGGNSSQGGSSQRICCIWCGSRAHRYSVCPGGDNIVCRKEGGAWINKTTKEGYCYPFNIRADSTCPRTDCGSKFLHACSICGQKGHGAQNHGAKNRSSG